MKVEEYYHGWMADFICPLCDGFGDETVDCDKCLVADAVEKELGGH